MLLSKCYHFQPLTLAPKTPRSQTQHLIMVSQSLTFLQISSGITGPTSISVSSTSSVAVPIYTYLSSKQLIICCCQHNGGYSSWLHKQSSELLEWEHQNGDSTKMYSNAILIIVRGFIITSQMQLQTTHSHNMAARFRLRCITPHMYTWPKGVLEVMVELTFITSDHW